MNGGPALAIDAGQTGVRAALYHEGGPGAAAEARGVPRMNGTDLGPPEVAQAIRAAVSALDDSVPADLGSVGIGLSGFEVAGEDDLAAVATALGLAAPVTIATDGVTSLLGALGERAGAVVAAGTGTVAMARDGDRWAKVDGVGPLLGDAGSGFAIGRAGLDAALRWVDGRAGGSDTLASALDEEFGNAGAMARLISRSERPIRAVAGFTEAVAEAAAGGDEVAGEILAGAARELAESVAAAARRVFGDSPEVAVSSTGNVFRAGPALTEPFAAEVARLLPGCELVSAAGGSLDGAAVLASAALTPIPGVLWRSA